MFLTFNDDCNVLFELQAALWKNDRLIETLILFEFDDKLVVHGMQMLIIAS